MIESNIPDEIFDPLFVPAVNPITVVYVPSHLYHMVFELFKVGFILF